jgi:hypothetical protein
MGLHLHRLLYRMWVLPDSDLNLTQEGGTGQINIDEWLVTGYDQVLEELSQIIIFVADPLSLCDIIHDEYNEGRSKVNKRGYY